MPGKSHVGDTNPYLQGCHTRDAEPRSRVEAADEVYTIAPT
jgi:hypothetical protein